MIKPGKLKKLFIVLLILLFIFGTVYVFARAGGAGGGRSSGGSGGGDGGAVIFWVIMLMVQTIGPIPTAIVVIVALILLSVFGKKMKAQSPMKNLHIPEKPAAQVRGYKDFIRYNPGFDEDAFKKKVSSAFTAIQNAWSTMNLSGVRRYISDGVYQRFTTQFTMMKLLKQRNPIDNIRIHSVTIVKFETDGRYDSVDVAIKATMRDKFVCETNHSLDSPGGDETFTEFWSFLKKRGIEEKDIYSSNSCPNCSAPLQEDMGEIGKCGYCGVMVNSGEFDWVLSEITQADDYFKGTALQKAQNLHGKIQALIEEYEDFSVQLLEDKASNGYLQIQTAMVQQDPAVMRRFVTDEAYEKLKSRIPDRPIVFNRLFLNDVSLIGASKEENRSILLVSVTLSYQRVLLKENGKADIIDPSIISRPEVMVLQREAYAGETKGSLYSHTCPSCGGSVQDSLDLNCTFCGVPLNSEKSEWIIADIMSMVEYRSYFQEKRKGLDIKVSPDLMDSLFEVKDYALNNVMVMIGADGIFAEEEKSFARSMARKWGFNAARITPLFDLAKSGRLSIKMPSDPNKRRAIYKLMVKAAEADQDVSREEKDLLAFVEKEYL